MRGFVGKELGAITLNVVGNGATGEFTEALTDNYLKLRLRGRHEPNRWLLTQVEDVVDGALMGFKATSVDDNDSMLEQARYFAAF